MSGVSVALKECLKTKSYNLPFIKPSNSGASQHVQAIPLYIALHGCPVPLLHLSTLVARVGAVAVPVVVVVGFLLF